MSTSPQLGRPSNTLHFLVGEMSGKLDQVLSTLLTDRARVDSLEGRVTTVERWQWKVIGGGSIIVLLLGTAEVWQYVAGRH